MPAFLLILLYIFLSFPIYAEDENTFDYEIIQEETNEIQASHKEKQFLLDKSIYIRKNQIKSSKSKNMAELIKEYSNIDIKNKTVYSQSTFILNGKVLNNDEKKIYLFLYDKNNIDSININYYASRGRIVYDILSKKYSKSEELLYTKLSRDVKLESDKTIKYVKTQTNASKSSGKMNLLEYNIKNQNLYQGGNIGLSIKPHDIVTVEDLYFISSRKDLLTNNNQYLTTQGSKTSIIFNIPIKDISSTIRIKGNYSYLVGKNLYNVSVNNNDLPGLPRHQFNTSLEYIYSRNNDFESSILLNVQYIGDQYNNTTKSEVDKSYTTFDIISSFVFKKDISLKFGVKNVLDVKYETIKGYPISSREYFVNVSAKLR